MRNRTGMFTQVVMETSGNGQRMRVVRLRVDLIVHLRLVVGRCGIDLVGVVWLL